MTRDYKYYGTRRNEKPRWRLAVLALTLGLGVGLGVAWYLKKPSAASAGAETAPPTVTATPTPTPPPAVTAPKPDENKQRYDFYTLLPEMELVVPDGQQPQGAKPPADNKPQPAPTPAPAAAARPASTTPAPAPPAEPPAPKPAQASASVPAATPGGGDSALYVLQAGSFLQPRAAESLKANLALLGVQSTVQPVTVGDEVWHRVFIGPYKDSAYATQLQQQLHNNQINAQLMRVDHH